MKLKKFWSIEQVRAGGAPPKSATALFWLDVVFVEQLTACNILPKSPEGVNLFGIGRPLNPPLQLHSVNTSIESCTTYLLQQEESQSQSEKIAV